MENKIFVCRHFGLERPFYIREIENNLCFFFVGEEEPFFVESIANILRPLVQKTIDEIKGDIGKFCKFVLGVELSESQLEFIKNTSGEIRIRR